MIKRFHQCKMLPLAPWRGHLSADIRGVAAVEFAIVAAPLAALIVAILQTSLVFFAQQTLETTAETSVRQLVTGEAQKGNVTKAQFKSRVCSTLPVFMECSKVIIDVRSATSFSGISTKSLTITVDKDGNITTPFSYAPGNAGSINIVRVMYIWDVMGGPLGFDLATMSNNKRILYATSVFKTEPYT